MFGSTTEERVTELEELMVDLLRAQERTQRHLDQLSRESRDFKTEMRATTARMEADTRALKEGMRASAERTEADTRAFKEEMRAFKAETNKKWGDLANKMGTMAEDLVAPSVPRILKEVTGCGTIERSAVRMKVRHQTDPGRSREFDVLAVCGDYLLLNETKSRLIPRDVDDLVEALQEARQFLPEFAGKKIIGSLASLYVDEGLVRYGEQAGLLVLGMGKELMDVLNSLGFTPREF